MQEIAVLEHASRDQRMRQLHQDRPPRAEKRDVFTRDAPGDAVGTRVAIGAIRSRLRATMRYPRNRIVAYRCARPHGIVLEAMGNGRLDQVSQMNSTWGALNLYPRYTHTTFIYLNT
jgi:hypothetical protein